VLVLEITLFLTIPRLIQKTFIVWYMHRTDTAAWAPAAAATARSAASASATGGGRRWRLTSSATTAVRPACDALSVSW